MKRFAHGLSGYRPNFCAVSRSFRCARGHEQLWQSKVGYATNESGHRNPDEKSPKHPSAVETGELNVAKGDEKAPVAAALVLDANTEKTTGEIDHSRREFLLYYSRLFIPSGQFGRWVPQFLYRRSKQSILNTITTHLPKGLPVVVKDFIPREREGGAFVKFAINDSHINSHVVENDIINYVNEHSPRFPRVSPLRWRVYPVMGKPWIEDMRRRYTTTIKVTFDGPDIKPWELYRALRRYGRIKEIIPPPPSNKDIPRSAIVTFWSFIDATTARNCANGEVIGPTTIYISFIMSSETSQIKEWLSSHPRVAIPLIVAILAGLAYLIFEPIRIYCIESTIHGTYLSRHLKFLGAFKRTVKTWGTYVGWGTLDGDADDFDVHSWKEMRESAEEMEQALSELTSTFIVVTGPRGSGKAWFLQHVLKGNHRPLMEIDCEDLYRAKSPNEFLGALSHALGYFPVFLWTNNLSKFIDLAAQSLSGQSSGFSETTDEQSKHMLDTAAIAIHRVALRGMPEGAKEPEYLQRHIETKPIVVLKNFNGTTGGTISKLLADWAGGLVSQNVAQVIVITNDVGYGKLLREALPNRVFELINIGDSSPEASKRYIVSYLKKIIEENDKKGMKEIPKPRLEALRLQTKRSLLELENMSPSSLEPLGGRLTDLQAFTRRLVAGETPHEALESMINQSAVEISQLYLNTKSADWTPEQAWAVIRYLSTAKSDKTWAPIQGGLAGTPAFSDDDKLNSLQALQYREMISGLKHGGRLVAIRPEKPLYFVAFKELVKDPVLSCLMDIKVLKYSIKYEESKIQDVEPELVQLALLSGKAVDDRRKYLDQKMLESQTKIQNFEKLLKVRKKELDDNVHTKKYKF